MHLNDVGVVQETLDLDLPDQLDEKFLINVVFVDSLNGTKEAGLLMFGQENLPKFSRPQSATKLEIFNLHCWFLKFSRMFDFGKGGCGGNAIIKLLFFV